MILSLLFCLFFAASGVCISEAVFHKHRLIDRLWLGLTLGLLLLTWLPSLFAFLIGFTKSAQWFAMGAAAVLDAVCIPILIHHKKLNRSALKNARIPSRALICVALIVLIGAILLHTHILYRHANGSLWVGQVTYGDLAMHLGFITSIAEQTAFPPQYSIFPGHALNYPFLCETSGASLYLLGANVRQAYLITAIYALILVVLGVYRFMTQWLKKQNRALLATILFFFGGGFGFFYFFDLAKSGGILNNLLGAYGQTVSQTLLDGFYQTPTNIPALGLRWVNVIVDMLIPQRATLFGWAFLFPCLYLLHGFAFERKRQNVVMLGILAGALPLIHTHSFLALGIISAVYCISDLIAVQFEKKRLLPWLLYAAIACVLAAPQLFFFSFRQAAESSLVRFHLNWGNLSDSYLWFYLKNMGCIFLLMPFAFLILPKRDKKIYSGVLAVWLISEFLEFQPNDYDNNKLLFIWFAFTCAIDSKLVCFLAAKAKHAIQKKHSPGQILKADRSAVLLLLLVFFVYLLCKMTTVYQGSVSIHASTATTLAFLSGFLLVITVFSFKQAKRLRKTPVDLLFTGVFACMMLSLLLIAWLHQYTNSTFRFSAAIIMLFTVLSLAALLFTLLMLIKDAVLGKRGRFAGGRIAYMIAVYLFLFSVMISSTLTIVREARSQYQVYTAAEVELAHACKENTDPDDVILANSYHWNIVTPLTGRSIVTGTGTFLYYHGIDNTERMEHVRQMFEEPADHLDLFRLYGVRYVLVSNAERMNYDIDYLFLRSKTEIVAQNDAGYLYRLSIDE